MSEEVRRTVTITNKKGLHARASAKFVTAVSKLGDDCQVRVSKDNSEVIGTSIMGLMMLGAATGDEIKIIVTGERAEAAADKLAGLVMDGFGED